MKKLRYTFAVAMTVTAVATGLVVTGGPAAAAPCGKSYSDKDSSSWPRATRELEMVNDTNYGCPTAGWIKWGDYLDYHCWAPDYLDQTWTFLRNNRTGIQGWVKDTNLPRGGAVVRC